MNEQPISLFQRSKAGVKKNPGALFAATFSFWIMTLVAIAPSLLSPIFLFLTVPLVFAPSLFVYIASAGGLSQDSNFALDGKTSWGLFFSYFTLPYRGAFKLMLGFLKAMLAFFAAALAVSAFMGAFATMIWPDFNETINAFYNLMETASANDILDYLQESVTLSQYLTISVSVVFGVAFLFFLHHCFLYGLNCYSRLLFPKTGFHFADTIFRRALAGNRLEFSKKYYGFAWPLYLLLLLGYVGGVVLGLFLSLDLVTVLSVSMAMSVTLALCYLPFYEVGIGFLADDLRPWILGTATTLAKSSLDQLRAMQAFSAEEIEAMEKALKDYEERVSGDSDKPKEDDEDHPEDPKDE